MQGALRAEPILNLGHVLPIPYLPTEKEVKKPCGFLRIFGYFLCAQKVPKDAQEAHGFLTSFPVGKRVIYRTWSKLCIDLFSAPLPLTL